MKFEECQIVQTIQFEEALQKPCLTKTVGLTFHKKTILKDCENPFLFAFVCFKIQRSSSFSNKNELDKDQIFFNQNLKRLQEIVHLLISSKRLSTFVTILGRCTFKRQERS